MQSRMRKVLAALVFGGAFILSWGMTAAAQQQDQSSRRGSLEGTWLVQVTLRNCQTGAPVGAPPFLSLISFARGGTMTETTSNPSFYPLVRGPGHGVWSRTAGRNYRASSIALITSQGALAQTQVITQAILLDSDRNSFKTTKASVQFFKPDGTLILTGCASAVGTRFE